MNRLALPDMALSEMKSRAVRRTIRAELEGTRSTHPDNPFTVSDEVTGRTDSRHFDSPVERRFFEDVAGVSGNRCFKHGSSSTVVDWQTTVRVFFSRPGYQEKYLLFPSVAHNKRHAQRVPSDVGNGQSKFGGDTIAFRRYLRASESERDRQEMASSWEKSGRRPQSHFRPQ